MDAGGDCNRLLRWARAKLHPSSSEEQCSLTVRFRLVFPEDARRAFVVSDPSRARAVNNRRTIDAGVVLALTNTDTVGYLNSVQNAPAYGDGAKGGFLGARAGVCRCERGAILQSDVSEFAMDQKIASPQDQNEK